MTVPDPHDPPRPPIPRAEFVPLIAAVLALGAIGIDAMLPALPEIGRSLGLVDVNSRQLVITAYMVGFGLGQLVHGPLADRFGRRPVLIAAIGCYAVATVACAAAGSFAWLLLARLGAGLAVAATRVVTVALVRDCFAGRAMGQVMSLAFMVFMAAPILAPTLGQAVMLAGSWRLIFGVIAALALLVLGWFSLRMPETLAAEDRRPLSPRAIAGAVRVTLADRTSLGYTLAATCMQAALFGYINSVQQIIGDVFGRPELLAAVFAGSAGTMAVMNLLNSRIVMRLGMRRISHGAVCALVFLSVVNLAVVGTGTETLGTFAILQALTMGCFGLAASNFSTLAMERMGHLAGSASSVQGFVATTFGALIGAGIGQRFDGTTLPVHLGFLGAGIVALAVVAVVERGRLFQPH